MFTALRRSWGKQAVALVTVLTVALPVTVVAAIPAAAAPAPTVAARVLPAAAMAPTAGPCRGERIAHKRIKAGSSTVGWLDVFYSRSLGVKCAITKHAGASYGKWAYTKVEVWTRNGSSSVGGDYRYNTGPASIGGAEGVCVGARGSIAWGGASRVATARMLCG